MNWKFSHRDMARASRRGFTLIEAVVTLAVVLILVGMMVPVAVTILQSQRAQDSSNGLETLYHAIAGNPTQGTFGYLGDVEEYPDSLLDLVQEPASAPPGWNGPYVSNVMLDNNILIDAFGGAIEYFNAINPGNTPDSLALISKGPDRTSTNTAANPNQQSGFTGTLPSDPAYGSNSDNQDNIAHPDFIENAGLLDYQSIGTLAINIFNIDSNPELNALVPGCPGLYTVTVASATRGADDELSLAFNPGLTIDLVQGIYDVTVASGLAVTPLWQERVAIHPSATLTRTLNLGGLDSSSTAGFSLTVTNNTTNDLDIFQFTVKRLPKVNKNGGTATFTVNGCALINVKDKTTGLTIDQFTMPFLSTSKIYVSALSTLCVTNSGTITSKLVVLDQGLTLGTVHKLGNRKTRCFQNIRQGNTITITDQDGTVLSTFPMPATNFNVTI